MLDKKLEQLGFTDKEQKVYLALLSRGQLTATEIAKITGIKRPTIYSVTKELIKKGVIEEELAAKKQRFLALSPETLSNLTYKEEAELSMKKDLIKSVTAELEEMREFVGYSVPKITFVPEEEIEKFLYKQTKVWNESIMNIDNTWWGFQDPTFVKNYEEWIDWYWRTSLPNGLVLKLLTSESQTEVDMKAKGYGRRMVKFWNKGESFTATTWVNGDYIVMIVTNKKPYYLVQIHDARMAENLRGIFKGIWEDVDGGSKS